LNAITPISKFKANPITSSDQTPQNLTKFPALKSPVNNLISKKEESNYKKSPGSLDQI